MNNQLKIYFALILAVIAIIFVQSSQLNSTNKITFIYPGDEYRQIDNNLSNEILLTRGGEYNE